MTVIYKNVTTGAILIRADGDCIPGDSWEEVEQRLTDAGVEWVREELP